VSIADAQKIARAVISLSVVQSEPCTDIGQSEQVDGVERLWGDVDCGGSVSIADAQKIARWTIGLSVAQSEPCPDIGTLVQVPA